MCGTTMNGERRKDRLTTTWFDILRWMRQGPDEKNDAEKKLLVQHSGWRGPKVIVEMDAEGGR